MQRVREDTSYAASMEIYLNEAKGDVWTVEMKDRNFAEIELFERFKDTQEEDRHRGRQPPHAPGRPARRGGRRDPPRLRYIPPERLIVSSDCGFGRQGCNREIAFYKASALAQGCNIVRGELGLPAKYIAAADPALQIDIVPA